MIQLKGSEAINYGKLIYHNRVQLNMTQEELSRGICSISYLSKLENLKVESSNEEVLELLLERLNIDLSQLSSGEETERDLITWYKSIQIRDMISAKKHYSKLKSFFDSNVFMPELTYWFEIICLRYFALLNDHTEMETKLKKLSKLKKNFNIKQQIYLNYFTGIYYCKKKNFELGLQYLNQTEKQFKEENLRDQEIDFHLALTYSHLNKVPLAIYHTRIALEIFNEKSLFHRSIDCQMLIGINMGRVGKFEEAENQYLNIIGLANQLNDAEILGMVYTNLGCLYQQSKLYSKSINSFLESLTYKKEHTINYGNSIYGLVESHLLNNDIKQGLVWIEKGLKKISSCDITTKIKLTKLKMEIKNQLDLATYLEDIAIPYFLETADYVNLCESYEQLADHFSQMFQYKKSSHFYCLSNTIRKTHL
ncbi:helix-turn-helix domain-containing protein (plasmid) [Rossellomorea sp. FS2]|uniref:helix-turn-helix domain-containing protein n=1 Tax=Rossellomorea sp. FS2 TaxID=3391447 RepID=UPI003A4E1B96